MASGIAQLLRQWRSARGLTLSALALLAGVQTSTLSRWESGQRRPLLPELEAVLKALDVTPTERIAAIQQLAAPRALHSLPQIAGIRAPLTGDLLRSIRIRRGLTQTVVAAAVGVRQGTLAKWESSEDWPSTERLHQLCFLLKPHESELTTLLLGRFAPPLDPLQEVTVEALEAGYISPGDPSLWELRTLSYVAALWPQAAKFAPARRLLARIYAEYAHGLAMRGRLAEVESLASHALALSRDLGQVSDFTLVAVINQADAIAKNRTSTVLCQARNLLHDWLPHATNSELEAWMLSKIGRYYAADGDIETALQFDAASGRKPLPSGGLCGETAEGRLITTRLLLSAGKIDQALDRLPGLQASQSTEQRARIAVTHARALLDIDCYAQAHEWLQRAYGLLEGSDYHPTRAEADELALRF